MSGLIRTGSAHWSSSVRADGNKELVALADGHRGSTESWAGPLRDARRRGMRAPVLAVGDGALGFWAALTEVFPDTRHGRCWVHKAVNVLDCLQKSAQPAAPKEPAEIRDAEDRRHAEQAIKESAAAYGAKCHKAVAKITSDQEQLLAFFDFPAEHWVHMETSNLIESTSTSTPESLPSSSTTAMTGNVSNRVDPRVVQHLAAQMKLGGEGGDTALGPVGVGDPQFTVDVTEGQFPRVRRCRPCGRLPGSSGPHTCLRTCLSAQVPKSCRLRSGK
jgi:hypothetical protein